VPEPSLPHHLRAVIFDVDGTLYRQRTLRYAMARRLVRAHLYRPLTGMATMRILSAYRRGQEALRGQPLTADVADAQLRFASRETGAGLAAVQATVTRWMEEAPLDLLARHAQPGMQAFVHDLRARGLKLGVLSDYPAEAKLAALGVGGMFHSVLCAQSPEVGVFKPDPRGILVSIDRLGVAADEALYVGDRAEVDAVAARAAGVVCAILTSRKPAQDAGFLAVQSFAELGRLVSRHFDISSIAQGIAPQ
jgi:HAD superfamily hydrolase (TIGR01549 family)